MRLDLARLASRRSLLTTTVALSGVAAVSALAIVPISALRAAVQKRVSISVGSQVKLFHEPLGLSQEVQTKIRAPRVARVWVAEPKIENQIGIESRDNAVLLSAIDAFEAAEAATASAIGREVAATLKQRFQEALDIDGYQGDLPTALPIVLVEKIRAPISAVTLDRSSPNSIDESQMHRKDLIAVLMGRWQEAPARRLITQAVVRKPKAIKKSIQLAAVPSHKSAIARIIAEAEAEAEDTAKNSLEVLAEVAVKKPSVTAPTPAKVAADWVHTQAEAPVKPTLADPKSKLEYSQLIALIDDKPAGTRVAETVSETQSDTTPPVQIAPKEEPKSVRVVVSSQELREELNRRLDNLAAVSGPAFVNYVSSQSAATVSNQDKVEGPTQVAAVPTANDPQAIIIEERQEVVVPALVVPVAAPEQKAVAAAAPAPVSGVTKTSVTVLTPAVLVPAPSKAPTVAPIVVPVIAPVVAPPAETPTQTEQKVEAESRSMVAATDLENEAAQQPAIQIDRIRPYGGVVVEAFTGGTRPVGNATVQVLGAPLAVVTDDNGSFAFDDKLNVQGVLPVVIIKDGYYKRRIDLRRNNGNIPVTQVELVSNNSVGLSNVAVGEDTVFDSGFVFGQLVDLSVSPQSVAGLRVEITGPTPIKPIYLDDNGIPSRALPYTLSRGQFMLVNVRPGTYMVNVIDGNGNEKAPHLIHVGNHEGVVKKFSLGEPRTIRGRLLNASAVNSVVEGATVQFLGSTKTAVTGKHGEFALGPINVDCYDSNYLQVDKSGYYRNRVDYACESGEHNVYVFSGAYVDSLSLETGTTLSPTTGVVVGHTEFRSSVKMQLWGPEEINPATEANRGTDYYMDTDGVLNAKLNRTSKNGNFAILTAPDGLSYIQAFSKNNQTLSFWPIFLSASTVNVYLQ